MVVERPARLATGPERLHEERSRSASMLILLGGSFLVVGVADLLLLWLPVRFASIAWEFATVGRTLDSLPMPALGLGLVTYGASRHPRVGRTRIRALGIAFGVAAFLVLVLGLLFATSAPAVLASTPPEAMDGVRRAVFRHVLQSVVYTIVFAAISLQVWRWGQGGP